MKVLLVRPFKDTGLSDESYLPIGLDYLATSLRKDNHEVNILDYLKKIMIIKISFRKSISFLTRY